MTKEPSKVYETLLARYACRVCIHTGKCQSCQIIIPGKQPTGWVPCTPKEWEDDYSRRY